MTKRSDDSPVSKGSEPISAEEAAARWPQADADRAGKPPPHPDAEKMERAMRERGGFIVTDDDDPKAQERRRAPTNPGIP